VYFDLREHEGLPVEPAIQRAFGMSSAQFDKLLRDYVKGGKFKGYTVPTPPGIVTSEYGAAPVGSAQAAAVLADVHLHSQDYREQAMEEFQAVLKTDPDNATAWRGLGYAYLMKKQYAEAGERFRRAAQLDPKDPRVHYYSALLMQGQGFFVDRSRLPEMIKELETTVALDPTFAEAYSRLGQAQSANGDIEQGMASMKKAIALKPHNERYLHNMAVMYMNHREPDQAIAIYEMLARSEDPQIALQAKVSLILVRKMKEALAANARPEASEDVTGPRSAGNGREPSSPAVTRAPATNAGRVQFIQGDLTAVDCSTPPAAVLMVTSGSATWKFTTADTHRVAVLGADAFSCSWSKQKVALNYVQTGPSEGRIVSIEIQ
jgi:Flp pilus assembly protein TadD